MGVKADLLHLFSGLPKLDDVDQRKAFVTASNVPHIAIYLDWSGSQVEFAGRLIDEVGRRGQRFMASFLAAAARTPQIRDSLEWPPKFEAMRFSVEALQPDAWLQEFPPVRLTARDRTGLVADREMLANTLVSGTLLPYYALGEETLAAQVGLDAVQVATDVAARLKEAMTQDPRALDRFAADPRGEEGAFLARVRVLLDGDDTLVADLAGLLTARSDREEVDELAWWLTAALGVDRPMAQPPAIRPIPEVTGRQINELVVAQREAAVQGQPVGPRTLYNLGRLAAYKRDYATALDYFRQATQVDPEYSDAYWAIAWLQQSLAQDDLRNGVLASATARLAEARTAGMHSDPNDPLALTQRGYTAKALAQLAECKGNQADRRKYYEEAAGFFGHVVKLDPDNPGAQNGLGNMQHALGNLDAAIAAYRRAVDLEPHYTAAYHDLAIACEQKMQAKPADAKKWRREALAAWRKAYELAPDDPAFTPEYIVAMGQRIRRLEEGL